MHTKNGNITKKYVIMKF